MVAKQMLKADIVSINAIGLLIRRMFFNMIKIGTMTIWLGSINPKARLRDTFSDCLHFILVNP